MKNMIKTKKKTIIVAAALCMLLISGLILSKLLGVSFAENNVGQGDTVKVGNGKYKIISEYDSFAQYIGPTKRSVKSVTIPDTIKVGGKTYKVVSIGDSACNSNCGSLKKLTIGRNVICIGARAFRFCEKLKSVTIKTTHLTNENVKQLSFYDLNKKVTIIVPEQKLTEYTKILKSKDVGLTGKNQKVKGKRMEELYDAVFDLNSAVPDPEVKMGINTAYELRLKQTKETNEYSARDTIPVAMKIRMDQKIYYRWQPYMAEKGFYIMCGTCGRMFKADKGLSNTHTTFDNHTYVPMNDRINCVLTNNIFGYKYPESFVAWRQVYSQKPCSAVIKITLPDGLDYKDGSIGVFASFILPIEDFYGDPPRRVKHELYQTEVNGNEVTITIDDVRVFTRAYDNLYIELGTEMNDSAADSNVIEASLVYNYGEGNKTVDFNEVTVLKP